MPELTWIGKEKVLTHHLDVPFRVLEHRGSHTAPTPLQLCGIIVVLAAIVIAQKSPMRASAGAS